MRGAGSVGTMSAGYCSDSVKNFQVTRIERRQVTDKIRLVHL